jgi:hypothetical protein
MTSKTPQPPTSITARQPTALEGIAAAAAILIAEARAAGLTPPCALNCHDYYSPPATALFISDSDTPDIWHALQQWADRYETQITTRPTANPENTYASAEFRHNGISYEIYSIIHPSHQDTPHDEAA